MTQSVVYGPKTFRILAVLFAMAFVSVMQAQSLSVTTQSLPNGNVGVPYSGQLAAIGGVPPYAWSAIGLPTGLAMNPSNGVVIGTPTSATIEGWLPTSLATPLSSRAASYAVWTGSRVLVWGGVQGSPLAYVNDGASYDPSSDAWMSISSVGAPSPRAGQIAIWTGSRMIVWGGVELGTLLPTLLNTGGVYDPQTDTWTSTSTVGAPGGGDGQYSVWTGSRMVVWSGASLAPGGSYDPTTNTWTALSVMGRPSDRNGHTVIWTGSRVIVWGGWDGNAYCGDGASYDPVTNSWAAISTVQAPLPRRDHTAVWTGSRMVVWGGDSLAGTQDTGGVYDPVGDTWTSMSTIGAPLGRSFPKGIWTGGRMLIWGGATQSTYLSSGGLYDPVANSWTPTMTFQAPIGRAGHAIVWIGSRAFIWGGTSGYAIHLGSGALYSPPAPHILAVRVQDALGQIATRSVALSIQPEPLAITTVSIPIGTYATPYVAQIAALGGHPPYAWISTGLPTGLSINAGTGAVTGIPAVGGTFSANITVTDAFAAQAQTTLPLTIVVPTPPFGVTTLHLPNARVGEPYSYTMSAVGGTSPYSWSASGLPSGMSINAQSGVVSGIPTQLTPDGWDLLASTGAPTPRRDCSMVWTGERAIVWGGEAPSSGFYLGNGGMLNPATGEWSPVATAAAPTARSYHSAVWTGSKLIIWGGEPYPYLDTGGVYDPVLNYWTPTSTLGAPSPRGRHVAVWTGSRMVVWGSGIGGGRFDPVSNSWLPMSTVGAPHWIPSQTAVWTGTHMLLWGGIENSMAYSPGGKYDPVSDTWTPVSVVGAPSRRRNHTCIWTGGRMIVWGGVGSSSNSGLNTGGIYDPLTDTWTAVTTIGAPAPRSTHTAIWTGEKMLIWGGYGNYIRHSSGAAYNPATASWETMETGDSPTPRSDHSAVWTGSRMIVWGGFGPTGNQNDGGLYPKSDQFVVTVSDASNQTSNHVAGIIVSNTSATGNMDVNRDGFVDVVDVQVVANLILQVSLPAFAGQGETNGDNAVDIVDVQRIVNCILGLVSCS